MNIVDVVIILIIIMCGVVGYKRGLTNQLVSSLGIFAVIVLSFLLKNPVSMFLYEHLPFFKFGGIFKGITALNIILYEFIAFFLVMSILTIILKVLTLATNIFEKLLKMTIILGIPSKLLGMVAGFVEGFLLVFIGLYIISLPVFNFGELNNSKYAKPILSNTPILSKMTGNMMNVIDEFTNLKEEYEVTKDANEFNLKAIDLFLKYNVVTPSSVENLVKNEKLQIVGIEDVISKYKEEKK